MEKKVILCDKHDKEISFIDAFKLNEKDFTSLTIKISNPYREDVEERFMQSFLRQRLFLTYNILNNGHYSACKYMTEEEFQFVFNLLTKKYLLQEEGRWDNFYLAELMNSRGYKEADAQSLDTTCYELFECLIHFGYTAIFHQGIKKFFDYDIFENKSLGGSFHEQVILKEERQKEKEIYLKNKEEDLKSQEDSKKRWKKVGFYFKLTLFIIYTIALMYLMK